APAATADDPAADGSTSNDVAPGGSASTAAANDPASNDSDRGGSRCSGASGRPAGGPPTVTGSARDTPDDSARCTVPRDGANRTDRCTTSSPAARAAEPPCSGTTSPGEA